MPDFVLNYAFEIVWGGLILPAFLMMVYTLWKMRRNENK